MIGKNAFRDKSVASGEIHLNHKGHNFSFLQAMTVVVHLHLTYASLF